MFIEQESLPGSVAFPSNLHWGFDVALENSCLSIAPGLDDLYDIRWIVGSGKSRLESTCRLSGLLQ